MTVDLNELGGVSIPKTSEEITSDDVADPDLTDFDLFGPYVLLRPVKTHVEKTKGGIYIPDKTKGDIKYLNTVGRVLAIGPMAYKKSDGSEANWTGDKPLEVGDIVQYERFVGKKFRFKGVNLAMVKDASVLFRLGDATHIDQYTAIEED